ncbi:hypothetical protein [Azospirillum palustre]
MNGGVARRSDAFARTLGHVASPRMVGVEPISASKTSGHKKTSRRGRLDRSHGCVLMSASPGAAAGRRAGSQHAGTGHTAAGRLGGCSVGEARCKRTSSSL